MQHIGKTFLVMSDEVKKMHENQEIFLDWINKRSKIYNLRIHKLQDKVGEKNLIW